MRLVELDLSRQAVSKSTGFLPVVHHCWIRREVHGATPCLIRGEHFRSPIDRLLLHALRNFQAIARRVEAQLEVAFIMNGMIGKERENLTGMVMRELFDFRDAVSQKTFFNELPIDWHGDLPLASSCARFDLKMYKG